MARFKLGTTVVTRGVDSAMNNDPAFGRFVGASLRRYMGGDWGDTCEEDKKSNEHALKNRERILAVYACPETGRQIWIITERDRSVTTVLFPEEY